MNSAFFRLSWYFWALMAFAIAFSWGEAPIWVMYAGAGIIGVRMALYLRVKKDNPFSIPKVMIPGKVCVSGMYGYVRHPLYVSSILWFIAIPLVFRSELGLLASLGLIMITVWRIGMEEEFLSSMWEYRAYKQRVKWKLIPHVW